MIILIITICGVIIPIIVSFIIYEKDMAKYKKDSKEFKELYGREPKRIDSSKQIFSTIKPHFLLDFLDSSAIVVTFLFGLVLVFEFIVLVLAYTESGAKKAALTEQYNGLCYKVQVSQAKDELGYNNKDFIDEIQEYNTELASNKILQHNLVVGVFYPQIYDDLQFIDYNDMQYKDSEITLNIN